MDEAGMVASMRARLSGEIGTSFVRALLAVGPDTTHSFVALPSFGKGTRFYRTPPLSDGVLMIVFWNPSSVIFNVLRENSLALHLRFFPAHPPHALPVSTVITKYCEQSGYRSANACATSCSGLVSSSCASMVLTHPKIWWTEEPDMSKLTRCVGEKT